VTAAIDESFDYATLAERSLGDEWKNRTEAERKQFRELLEGLVRQSYRKSIDSTLGWDVEYRGNTVNETGTVVTTVSKNKSDTRKAPVSVDYVLLQNESKWRVVDVVIEGSSLVSNYRSQFTKLIKKKGFAELITKMKSKLAKGEG
jgi:phospholipid transport system substrate-binding protein